MVKFPTSGFLCRFKPKGIARWLTKSDYLIFLDLDLVGKTQLRERERDTHRGS
jgi:hypothetical protein